MNLRALLAEPYESPLVEDLLKFMLRLALAAPFFLSGRTKVVEGSWLTISDTTLMSA